MGLKMAQLGVVLAALGCTGVKVTQECSRRQTQLPNQPVDVQLAGQPLTVTMTLPIIVLCPDGPPLASSATTTVFDGANLPVPSQTDVPTTDTNQGYVTTVRFMASTAGVYTLRTTFEPSLGAMSRQVQVVADRSSEAPLAITSDCPAGVGRVRNMLVCQRSGSVALGLGTAELARVPGTEFRVADDVLWAWDTASVSRVQLTDAGVDVVTSALPALRGDAASAVGASPTTLATVTIEKGATWLSQVQVVDGGLARQRRVLARPPSANDWALVAGNGEVAYLDADSELCSASLDPDAGLVCTTIGLRGGEVEGDAFWVRARDAADVGTMRLTQRTPAVSLLTGRAEATLLDLGGPRPAFQWNGRVVVPRASDLVLESWTVPGVRGLGVGPGVAWLSDEAGRTVVFAR